MKIIKESACAHVEQCLNNVNRMRGKSEERISPKTVFTGVKMEKRLYNAARKRAASRHQTYSEYARQLIVRDVEPNGKIAA